MVSNEIQVIDPCTSQEWAQFVAEHPDAGIFHHPSWMRMLRDIYQYRIFALCLMKDGKVRAGIPMADVRSFLTGARWVSLPFSDTCQPLFPRDDPDAAGALMEYLRRQQGQRTPKIELRWGVDTVFDVFRDHSFVRHVLPLDPGAGAEALFKSFDKANCQRSVKIAEKEGVIVKECSTFEEFEVYYRLQVTTRKRLGVPAQPKSFFKGVWDYILQPGLGFTLIAFKDDIPLGGGVFFKYHKTLFYKYSASDMTYKALRPNHAFIWHGLKKALSEGLTMIDFGRSDRSNEGLCRFKRNWGATELDMAYTIIGGKSPKTGPSRVDQIVGAVIRNSPEFVCKASGELLYKHFA